MYSKKGIDKQISNKSFLRFFQAILLINFHFLPVESHAIDFSALKPYGGVEYVQRSLALKEGYGKGDFNKRLPQANAFLGIQINDYFSVEAGYLFSQAVTRTSFAFDGQLLGNVPLKPGQYFISENKINLTGSQINFVGCLPFGASGFSALTSIGISKLSLKAIHKPLGDDQDEILSPADMLKLKRTFSSKKIIPKLMVGFGYNFTNSLVIRILIGYEKTSQFKNIVPKESNILRMTLKNHHLCSVGLIMKF